MSEAFLNKAGNDFLGPPCVHGTRRELISASDDLVASDITESNSLGVTWLESDRCACGDVESLSVGSGAIEGQTRVSFDEVVVRSNLWSFISRQIQHVSRERTHLDWSIPVVCNLDSDPLTTLVNHNAFVLDYDGTRKSVLCIRRWLGCRE